MGLDLSLRAAAACALPLPWDFDLARVRTEKVGKALTAGASAAERVERIRTIAWRLVCFCETVRAEVVLVEDYAYGAGGANTTQLAELGGVLKDLLYQHMRLVAQPVPAARARKVLLQRVPRLGAGKLKPWVAANVRRLGGPTVGWTDDEVDAFVVANVALEHAGATAMTFQGE